MDVAATTSVEMPTSGEGTAGPVPAPAAVGDAAPSQKMGPPVPNLNRRASPLHFPAAFGLVPPDVWDRLMQELEFLNIKNPRLLTMPFVTAEMETAAAAAGGGSGVGGGDEAGSATAAESSPAVDEGVAGILAGALDGEMQRERILDAMDTVLTDGALKELMTAAHSSAPSMVAPLAEGCGSESAGGAAGVEHNAKEEGGRRMSAIGRTLTPFKARELLTNFVFVADTVLELSKSAHGDEVEIDGPKLPLDPMDSRIVRMQTARNAIDMMARWIRRVTFSLDSLDSLDEAMDRGVHADAISRAVNGLQQQNDQKAGRDVPEGPHAASIPLEHDTGGDGVGNPQKIGDGSISFLTYHAGGGLVPVRRSVGRTFHLVDASALRTMNSAVKVFLGGSCNPTTWRQDIAIPALEAAGITYYNPQVEDWTPELVEVEACAKRDATMLLFVIDAKTRAVASMNEVVEEICRGREVALVVQEMEEGNELAEGSPNLLKDLNRGRVYLRDIAKRYGVMCFKSIEHAVQYVVQRIAHY